MDVDKAQALYSNIRRQVVIPTTTDVGAQDRKTIGVLLPAILLKLEERDGS